MDAARFDSFTRAFGSTQTRRRVLKSLAASTVSAATVHRLPGYAEANHCASGEYHVTVSGHQLWTDTGLDLNKGDYVEVSNPQGLIKIAGSDPGKTTWGVGCNQTGADFAVEDGRCYQLIGFVGGGWNFDTVPSSGKSSVSGRAGEVKNWFFATHSGRLYLGVNDELDSFGDNTGNWSLCLKLYENYCPSRGRKYCYDTNSFSSGFCAEISYDCTRPSGTECHGNGTKCGRYGICLDGYCRTAKEDCLQNAMDGVASGAFVDDILANFNIRKKSKKKKRKNRCGEAVKELFFEIAEQLCFQQTLPFTKESCASLGLDWG